MKCTSCGKEDYVMWITREYHHLCYDCIKLYRKDKDEFDRKNRRTNR
jgi:hypothetical protein